MSNETLTFWITIQKLRNFSKSSNSFHYKITKGKPQNLQINEITVKCSMEINTDWFKRPMFEANLEIGSVEFPDFPSIKQIEKILMDNGITLDLRISSTRKNEDQDCDQVNENDEKSRI